MTRTALMLALGASALALGACNQSDTAEQANTAQTSEAAEAAGDKTIAAGIDQNGKFFQAAKAAGLDATLAGPGPYTVLVPDDAGFAKLPEGGADLMKPESRAQLTGLLTYHILPGTVLAEDIGKAIDNSKGKAMLATMGGGTLTATKDGDKIVLTDGNGGTATITQADEKFTNGVVHRIDGVLMPAEEAPPAAG